MLTKSLKRKQETSTGEHSLETDTDNIPKKKKKAETRNQHRRDLKLKDPMRKTEELQSQGIDATNLKTSKTGWQGVDFKRTDKGKALVTDWKTGQVGKQLFSFKRINYREQ